MKLRTALPARLVAATMAILASSDAFAAKIGLVIPLEGPFKQLGIQSQAGAEIAAAANGDALVVVEDECTSESGAFVAKTLIDEKADVAAGFLCVETLAAALPLLKTAQIPAITTSIRADSLTDNKEKTDHLVFRLAPRDDSESEALAKLLLPQWSKSNFAIIDDGTIHARDLAESFRAAAVEAGLKPVFTDTYRPGLTNQAALARRLQKAGASDVFIGGDVDDAIVISRDARAYGGLNIAMGEAGQPSGEVTDYGSILALALPDMSMRAEAAATNTALAAKGLLPDNYALLAHAAVQIAHTAANKGAPALIDTGPYETVIGTVRFNAAGDLSENPYRLLPLRNVSGAATPLPALDQP